MDAAPIFSAAISLNNLHCTHKNVNAKFDAHCEWTLKVQSPSNVYYDF